MEVFQVVPFDKNNAGDVAYKQIFHESLQNSKTKNNRISTGKIRKKSKKNKGLTAAVNKQKVISIFKNTNGNITAKGFSIKNKNVSYKKEKALNNFQNVKKTSNNNAIETTGKFSKKKQKKVQKSRSTEKYANASSVQQDEPVSVSNNIASNKKLGYKQRKREKLKKKLEETMGTQSPSSKQKQTKSLRERMMERLHAARFRYINEQMYSSDSKTAQKLFSKDPQSFHAYHEGYKQQVNKWPLNPLDVIIRSVQKMPKTHVIADFGCGDAKLARSVEHKVHSFDFVATNELVTACDMARVPLPNDCVDIVVFCLSLMGTNLHDYILEANRVLKLGGTLKIAEVESRFEDVQQFIEGLKKFNFKNIWKDLSHNLFYFLDFKKESNIKNKKKLPTISLNPCLYKKR